MKPSPAQMVMVFTDPRRNDGSDTASIPLYESRAAAEAAHEAAWGHAGHPIPMFGAFLPPLA